MYLIKVYGFLFPEKCSASQKLQGFAELKKEVNRAESYVASQSWWGPEGIRLARPVGYKYLAVFP